MSSQSGESSLYEKPGISKLLSLWEVSLVHPATLASSLALLKSLLTLDG